MPSITSNGVSELAAILGFRPEFIAITLYGLNQRAAYRSFTIVKRDGTTRTIQSPPDRLKRIQRQLARWLIQRHHVRRCSHGFEEKRSIVTNASAHAGNRLILNFDLEAYFDSFNLGRIRGRLIHRPYGLSPQAATVAAQIATLDTGVMPQGAPTSPVLSNILTGELDRKLIDLARQSRCVYTRYADDITFSSATGSFRNFPATRGDDGVIELAKEVVAAVSSADFAINPKKTRLHSWRGGQRVTGLTVNESPNVSRMRIRFIKTVLAIWRAQGEEVVGKYLEGHGKSRDVRSFIGGSLAFLRMVKGVDDHVVRGLAREIRRVVPGEAGPTDIVDVNPTPVRGVKAAGADYSGIIQRVGPSVILLNVGVNASFATAFYIGNGLFATAGHVCTSNDIKGYLHSLDEKPVAFAAVSNWEQFAPDVGLIRPVQDHVGPEGFCPLPLCSRKPLVGELAIACGFPSLAVREVAQVTHVGHIESLPVVYREPVLVSHVGHVEALPVAYRGRVQHISTSFASGGGLSGAPLLDRSGKVIGIMCENINQRVSIDPNTPSSGDRPDRAYGQAVHIDYLLDLRETFFGELARTTAKLRLTGRQEPEPRATPWVNSPPPPATP